jgi:hypothetical protein
MVWRLVASGWRREGLLEDAEAEIGYLAGLGDVGWFQADCVGRGWPVEEADAVAEQDGSEVDADFVDQTFLNALASDVGVDGHDVLVSGGGARSLGT